MGRRGPGATLRKQSAELPLWRAEQTESADDGLTRAVRVIRFLEGLPITSGSLAGQRLRLRPWQKKIVAAIYGRTDFDGRRVIRTALLTPPAPAVGLTVLYLAIGIVIGEGIDRLIGI